jgi:hypothetical protein
MVRIAYCLILIIIGSDAWADYSVDFIRITCIPETRYFEVEYKSVPGDAVFIGAGFEKKAIQQRLKIWRKHGYYDPSALLYECKLPDSTYLVTSIQPPGSERGMCGAEPRITLNFSRNGDTWLNNVTFGSDCFGGPTVTQIAIRDGQEGWDSRTADLCIASPNVPEFCEFLMGIYDVFPLSQDDIDRYIAAISPQKLSSASDELPKRKLSLSEFKQGTCSFPDLRLPTETIVYAIGDYGDLGTPLGYQIDQSGHEARRIDITVNEPNRPVVLMLGAYEPMVWNIDWTPTSKIMAVLASGEHRQAVSGLPKDTPLLISYYSWKVGKIGPCKSFYVIPESSSNKPSKDPSREHDRNKNLKIINQLAKDVFGRLPEYILTPNKDGKVIVGKHLPIGTKTVTSNDTPPDSFLNPKAPLAGAAGLSDAVNKGILRKATAEDAKAWEKGRPIDITGNKSTSPELWNAYVVLKQFVYPSGLYGANAATFYVPHGVPLPEGDRGHSTVYDFGSKECTGIMCPR